MPNNNNCETCKYGRIDSIGKIFCARYNENFEREHFCGKWVIKSTDNTVLYTENAGYIYIFSNPDIPGLLKVGMTKKVPDIRASELSGNTGVSSKYIIEYYGNVADRVKAEKCAHNRLKQFHHNKEFFKVAIGTAIYCVETISEKIERTYIKSGNEEKVFEYAIKRGKVPYDQIYEEWKIREGRKIKAYNDYRTARNRESEVEEYFKKQTGNQHSLFDYHKFPENHAKNNITTIQDNSNVSNNNFSNLKIELTNKEKEIERLKKELDNEKRKGFFKKLFSKK